MRDAVLAAFSSGPDAATDFGCSLALVAAALPTLSLAQVQNATAELANDGWLYSTIDEEHFKTIYS